MKFLNCRIDISKRVFRPRLETEFWVGQLINNLKIENCKLKIKCLDVFSGSGCIGIAILKNINDSKVDFVDISEDAIGQIKINLELNKISKTRYGIFKANLFEKTGNKKYDYIFANPPYVALDRIAQVQREVLKNDPPAALFSGKDGTVIIEKFFSRAKNYLKPGGKIFLEFDPLQKEKIKKIMEKDGLKTIFKKDQFGKLRWLEGRADG